MNMATTTPAAIRPSATACATATAATTNRIRQANWVSGNHPPVLAIARTVGWLPLTQFAWRIRFVVAAVAVAQSVADGRIAAGMVVAVFIPLTYLAPRWQRRWDMRSQDDSDRFVADHELGDALGRFLRRCPPEPRTLER